MRDKPLQSLKREVEACIRNHEGQYAHGVLADFREGYERRTKRERIRWSLTWLRLYRHG